MTHSVPPSRLARLASRLSISSRSRSRTIYSIRPGGGRLADFARPLKEHRIHLLTVALAIFAIGWFSHTCWPTAVEPIHAVAAVISPPAAWNRCPGARRDEIDCYPQFQRDGRPVARAREREAELNRLERFIARPACRRAGA